MAGVLRRCFWWRGLVALADTFSGGRGFVNTAAQQGAAPDRRQFGSFYSVSALLLVGRDWAAAGELSR